MSETPMKTVRIRATVEYDLEVPEDWTKKDIEFHRNEGTYCSDRLVDELEANAGTDWLHYTDEGYRPCMCGLTHFEVLEAPEKYKIRDPRLYM